MLFFERALAIQYEAIINQASLQQDANAEPQPNASPKEQSACFLQAKDLEKQPVFISTDNKLINFKQQIFPFWSDFC